MLAAVQASWPGSTRQMALVPSWQQLANPAAANAAAAAAEANLLQPLFAAAASEADWRRPLIVDSSGGLRLQTEQATAAVFPAVVYERAAVAANASRSSNRRSNKGQSSSTVTSASAAGLNPPPAHSNSYSAVVRNYNNTVKKEPSQLSPVKKRIKETKDHLSYELYRQQHAQQHSPLDPYGRPIIINDTPPLTHHSAGGSHVGNKIPEVITISDSDDESPATSVKPNVASTATIASSSNGGANSKIEVPSTAATTKPTPAASSTSTSSSSNKPKATPSSSSSQLRSGAAAASGGQGCPSVMALTPNVIRAEDFTSTQSTPCASRSHATSCVTVGDSDEDASPVKQEPNTTTTTTAPSYSGGSSSSSSAAASSLNKKTRLLKAQSEWMLSSLKEEESPAGASTAAPSRGPSSAYGSHSRLSMVDEKELLQRYSSTSTLRQDYLEQQLMYREDLESRAAAAAVAHVANQAIHERELFTERERDRDREFALHLAGPPMAHQTDYATSNSRQVAAAIAHHSRAAVEYIQPPVAHSQAAAIAASAAAQQQNEVLNVQRAAAAQLAAAAAHHYRQSSPTAASTVSSADFYAAAAAAAAAPTTVYVTTAGYQQIAIPPPPAPPPPAHHSRAVLAPTAGHPLPAHMQPAAAAAAALFPGHPQVAAAASYGYAPLSPGKTRYLY